MKIDKHEDFLNDGWNYYAPFYSKRMDANTIFKVFLAVGDEKYLRYGKDSYNQWALVQDWTRLKYDGTLASVYAALGNGAWTGKEEKDKTDKVGELVAGVVEILWDHEGNKAKRCAEHVGVDVDRPEVGRLYRQLRDRGTSNIARYVKDLLALD